MLKHPAIIIHLLTAVIMALVVVETEKVLAIAIPELRGNRKTPTPTGWHQGKITIIRCLPKIAPHSPHNAPNILIRVVMYSPENITALILGLPKITVAPEENLKTIISGVGAVVVEMIGEPEVVVLAVAAAEA
jgi:hypothetical protein